jgi:hypothetical protein
MIPDQADRVPDAIEPLIGYRAWYFSYDPKGSSLFPITNRGVTKCSPWDGANRRWVSAACRFETSVPPDSMMERLRHVYSKLGLPVKSFPAREAHAVPGEDCSCGFYAMKELGMVWRLGPDIILGRVQLAGKVIEYSAGYRAERARIAELIPIEENDRASKRLAFQLGLPLGPAVWTRELPPAA